MLSLQTVQLFLEFLFLTGMVILLVKLQQFRNSIRELLVSNRELIAETEKHSRLIRELLSAMKTWSPVSDEKPQQIN